MLLQPQAGYSSKCVVKADPDQGRSAVLRRADVVSNFIQLIFESNSDTD